VRFVSTFSFVLYKKETNITTTRCIFGQENAPFSAENLLGPRWGTLQYSPDPLTGLRCLLLREREEEPTSKGVVGRELFCLTSENPLKCAVEVTLSFQTF